LSTEGFTQGLQIIEKIGSRNTDFVRFLPKRVKLLADGAFYSQLMQMEEGYLDGHHGEWIMPPTELQQAARIFWQAGYQLHIHVNGDKGLNVVLDVISELNKEMPRNHKTVLHHYGYAGAAHAKRLAQLGISVSANPFYLWALGDKYADIGLGPERAHNITRLGDLEKHGVPLSFHSDLPMAPASPLKLASIAASRISAAGNLLAPRQRVSVATALRAITLDAARAIQQDNLIGSIEVGKLADFTVLDQDPLFVTAEKLAAIKVHATIVGGEVFANPKDSVTLTN
jgi:predicted amidohydrolase YtcJ